MIGREARSTMIRLSQSAPFELTGLALSSEPYEPYGCIELSGRNNIRPAE